MPLPPCTCCPMSGMFGCQKQKVATPKNRDLALARAETAEKERDEALRHLAWCYSCKTMMVLVEVGGKTWRCPKCAIHVTPVLFREGEELRGLLAALPPEWWEETRGYNTFCRICQRDVLESGCDHTADCLVRKIAEALA